MSDINYEDIIGDNIKKERLAKGWSQYDLAIKCDIKNTLISAYENKRRIPGLNSIIKIAKALDVSIDRLCFGDENESFINTAPNEGRKIVNCLYELWKSAVIYQNAMDFFNHEDKSKDGKYLMLTNHLNPIRRLMHSLNEYARNKDTYEDPDAYLETVFSSVATEINKNLKD